LLDGLHNVKHIKFKLLRFAGYVLRMDNYRITKDILESKFYGRRSVGRPWLRWEDDKSVKNNSCYTFRKP